MDISCNIKPFFLWKKKKKKKKKSKYHMLQLWYSNSSLLTKAKLYWISTACKSQTVLNLYCLPKPNCTESLLLAKAKLYWISTACQSQTVLNLYCSPKPNCTESLLLAKAKLHASAHACSDEVSVTGHTLLMRSQNLRGMDAPTRFSAILTGGGGGGGGGATFMAYCLLPFTQSSFWKWVYSKESSFLSE